MANLYTKKDPLDVIGTWVNDLLIQLVLIKYLIVFIFKIQHPRGFHGKSYFNGNIAIEIFVFNINKKN